MADLIAYTDLASYLGVTFSTAEQATAVLVCSAASDAVKTAANRSFEIQGAAADRYFTAQIPYSTSLGLLGQYYPWPGVFPFTLFTANLPGPILMVDDYFLSGQTLANITVTDKTTATTYTPTYAYPYNADSKGLPYTGLVFAAGTALSTMEGQIKVNAKWGYVTSIPGGVKDAALIQATRWFRRKDQAGDSSGGAGTMQSTVQIISRRLDGDVEAMLSAYRRRWGAV